MGWDGGLGGRRDCTKLKKLKIARRDPLISKTDVTLRYGVRFAIGGGGLY
jgi:hypothetical protein